MIRVYRVQNVEGSGPFKPGMSKFWADDDFQDDCKPHEIWPVAFGADLIHRKGRDGEHFGSAVREVHKIREWFSDAEAARIGLLGYQLVALNVDRILAENDAQLVFARRQPLANGAIVVPWPQKERPAP